jgi:glycosyltransferase involved in cell wall biosynthesis
MSREISHPLISIITAVLNRPRPLARTIQSVLEQDTRHLEHIVVDGGSWDETRAVLERFARPGLRFISESDDGIYDALNKGIRLARGSHICVLHADDVYLAGAITTMVEHVGEDPHAIWYADSRIGERRTDAPEQITPAIRLYNLGIAHQSIVAPRAAFDAAAAFNPAFRIVSDYVWMRDAYSGGLRFRKMRGCHVHLDASGLSSGQTEDTRRLFESEVAARTLLYYPFVPHEILSAIYRHRTCDASGDIAAWVQRMESSGESKSIARWSEFREALDDYVARFSTMRQSAPG